MAMARRRFLAVVLIVLLSVPGLGARGLVLAATPEELEARLKALQDQVDTLRR
jgi:cell division protein FtsB